MNTFLNIDKLQRLFYCKKKIFMLILFKQDNGH